MSKRKNDFFSEIVVGIFMIAVLGLLGYFTIVISGVDILTGRQRMTARAAFAQVGGLKDHDNVMYRGTKVGLVQHVEVTSTNLIVHFEVDPSVVIRETGGASVCNLSMLGGNYLLLEEGTGEQVDLAVTTLRGEPPSDWMKDFAHVAKRMSEFVDNNAFSTMATNLEQISSKVLKVVDRVERGEGTLGRLVSTDDELYETIRTTLANANGVSERIKRGEGTVGKLVTDESLFNELKESVATLKNTIASVDTSKLNAGFDKLGEGVGSIVDDTKRLISNLTEVSERLKRGEGTFGRLANSDELYREIDGLVRDARQVLDNYRDTTPISTFGSLIGGAL